MNTWYKNRSVQSLLLGGNWNTFDWGLDLILHIKWLFSNLQGGSSTLFQKKYSATLGKVFKGSQLELYILFISLPLLFLLELVEYKYSLWRCWLERIPSFLWTSWLWILQKDLKTMMTDISSLIRLESMDGNELVVLRLGCTLESLWEFKNTDVSSIRLQNARSIYRNQLYFYTLAKNDMIVALRQQFHL